MAALGLAGCSSVSWNSVIQSQHHFSCDSSTQRTWPSPLVSPDSISPVYGSPTQPEKIIKGAKWDICQVPRAGDVGAGPSPGLCGLSQEGGDRASERPGPGTLPKLWGIWGAGRWALIVYVTGGVAPGDEVTSGHVYLYLLGIQQAGGMARWAFMEGASK